MTYTITTFEKPKVDFSYVTDCRENGIQFNDATTYSGTISQWFWDFSDGVIESTIVNPKHIFAKSNNNASQLVTYKVIGAGGCSDVISKTITIYQSPRADFIPDPDTTVGTCKKILTTFNNNSDTFIYPLVSGYSWDFGDTSYSSQVNPTHGFTYAGKHSVMMIATSSAHGCKDTVIHFITVFESPVSSFTYKGGCKGLDTKVIATSLAPDSLTTMSYEWDFGDGTGTLLTQNASHQYADTGTYNVILITTTNHGCIDSITAPIRVHPVPLVDFNVASICQGTPTLFVDNSSISGDSIKSYYWDFGDGANSTDKSPYHPYDDAVTFDVSLTVTSSVGCVGVLKKTIDVHAKPIADFSADPNPVSNDSPWVTFTNLSKGITSYVWDFGDSSAKDVLNSSPVHQFRLGQQDTGRFYTILSVANQFGCKDSKIDTIYVKQFLKIFFPNVITCNNDGLNDDWKPVAKGVYKYHCKIIDRWGQIMYESDNFDLGGWKGDYLGNGITAPEGVYMYYINVTDYDNLEIKKFKGNITILK
ncbi:MAG: PKD domain-containing protein [Bacteroidetes bacterium]|nr:PKD domain-containing protein [Bacteroidota bacterium]